MRSRVAAAIMLAGVAFAIYSPVFHNPFANYDDADYVVENVNVHGGLTLATLRWAFTSTEHANWHPSTWLSHAADWQLFGQNAAGHHLTSLLLHAANVVLLFLLLERITQTKLRSLAVAALFAVHPLNVESVVWVAERKNVLCMFFFLLTVFAYVWYARRPAAWRYLLVVLAFAAGLAAKPMVVTAPFVLLLMDFWPLQRVRGWGEPANASPGPQAPLSRLVLEKIPLLMLSAADSVITMIAQNRGNALESVAKYALPARLGNAIISYVDYIAKLLWPARLAVFYAHPAGHLRFWQVALCALLLLTASGWIWRQRTRRAYLFVGWCWFLGTLVPVIGLVQVGDQGMADRYVYLPAIGFFIMTVWGIADAAERIPAVRSPYAKAALPAVLAMLSIVTTRQVRVWRSSYDLWTQVLAVDKNNANAEDVVGSEILVRALNRGLTYSDEAEVHFENALRINPKDSEALLNAGAYLQAHGEIRAALEKYQLARQYATDPIIRYRVLTNMGSAYEKLGDLEASRRCYREALTLSVKDDPTAFVGFARTFTDEQIAALTKILRSNPTAEGYGKLGQLQESGGYDEDAIASYRHALEFNANFEAARQALEKLAVAKRSRNSSP